MIQAVRGTKDIIPGQIEAWQYLENIFRTVSSNYGYIELRTPIFEKTEVFARSIGEGTDIVNKEMYTFMDKGNESLTLRPEMTAALVRSVIQNNLLAQAQIQRLWYSGPFFRYERPQKGRLRQFHQYGAECLGSSNSESDAEIIQLANALISSCGISDYRLLINSLGNEQSRLRYKDQLTKYFNLEFENLSEDSKKRLSINPLRILDSKDEKDIEVLKKCPKIIDFLDDDSLSHFNKVKELLDFNQIDYLIDPNLVRGLDYYSHTVFEFRSNALGSQDSFGGGGRYDDLFAQLGGKVTPAVGFAFGIERLMLIMEANNFLSGLSLKPNLFIIATDEGKIANVQIVANELRAKGYSVLTDLQRRSVKAQLREANRIEAKYIFIIGDNELASNSVKIKNMISGEEIEFSLSEIAKFDFS